MVDLNHEKEFLNFLILIKIVFKGTHDCESRNFASGSLYDLSFLQSCTSSNHPQFFIDRWS